MDTVGPPGLDREQVTTLLDEALVRVSDQGVGSLVVLEGEAGVGKTTIVDGLADRARDRGITIRSAAASEIGRPRPFGLIVDALVHGGAPLADEEMLSQVVRSHAPDAPGATTSALSSRFGSTEMLTELIEGEAQVPGLLVLEDLHWADTGAAAVVENLAQVCAGHPLFAVITTRPGETQRLTDRLVRAGAQHHVVGGLTGSELTALLERLCGGPPGSRLIRQAERAGGNPLLLTEYINGLHEESRLIADAGVVDVVDDVMPDSMRVLMGQRIRELAPAVGDVIRPASVLGRHFRVGDVAALVQQPSASLADGVQQAIEGRIVEEADRDLRFRHDLFRDAIYHSMPASLRSALHQDAAQVLGRRGESAVVVGAHLVLSAGPVDTTAVSWLRRAASDTVAVTPEAALEFLDRALELTRSELADQLVIHRARMDALTSLGRLDEAEELVRWMLPNVPQVDRAELRAREAGLRLITGDGASAVALLQDAFAEAETDLDRARILALEAHARVGVADYPGATAVGLRAVEAGRAVEDPVSHSSGLTIVARVSAYNNDFAQARRQGEEAVAVADRDPTGLAHQYVPAFFFGHTALDADDLVAAEKMVARGRELSSQFTIEWSLPLFAALSAAISYRRGRLDLAAAEATSAVTLAEDTDSTQALMWANATLSLVANDTGDIVAAREFSDIAMAAWGTGRSPLCSDVMLAARATVLETEGDPATALEELVGAWEVFEAFDTRICLPTLGPVVGRLAHGLGDEERLASTAATITEIGQISGVPSIAAQGLWLSALSSGDAGEFAGAIEAYRGSPRRLELAACLGDAAVAATVANDARGGRPLADEAVAIFADAGAPARADRLVDRLRSVGGTAASVDKPKFGWEGLTSAEESVVRLLAQGMTNAQIAQERGVSRRTVESHLRVVYSKLAIDSRVKLTVAASQRFGE